ncbi:hypothetical protein PC121_g11040 [Phytophthora cactorum]|nr:hypothetical protein PC121_g11040 [Phytophthora cactorum]
MILLPTTNLLINHVAYKIPQFVVLAAIFNWRRRELRFSLVTSRYFLSGSIGKRQVNPYIIQWEREKRCTFQDPTTAPP